MESADGSGVREDEPKNGETIAEPTTLLEFQESFSEVESGEIRDGGEMSNGLPEPMSVSASEPYHSPPHIS